LEKPDGSVFAIEVKRAERVTMDDFKGIKAFQEFTGKDFIGGIVLYSGRARAFGWNGRTIILGSHLEKVALCLQKCKKGRPIDFAKRHRRPAPNKVQSRDKILAGKFLKCLDAFKIVHCNLSARLTSIAKTEPSGFSKTKSTSLPSLVRK